MSIRGSALEFLFIILSGLLVSLKLTGHIEWSWLVVFSPLIFLLSLFFTLIFSVITQELIKNKRKLK